MQNPTEVVDELAKRFFGSVARWQLLGQGHSPSRIGHWRRTGRLHLKYPGVYA